MAWDSKAYSREYWEKNKLRLLTERKAKREANLETHRARQARYQRTYRKNNPYRSVVPLPKYWVPRAVRRAGVNAPFKSKYGIYGMTEKSYPPSSWQGFESELRVWGIDMHTARRYAQS